MKQKNAIIFFLTVISFLNTLSVSAYGQNQCLNLFQDSSESFIESRIKDLESRFSNDDMRKLTARENVALDVVSKTFLTDKQISNELHQWVTALENREITVLEHVALSAIYRSEILKKFESKIQDSTSEKSDFSRSLEVVLSKSWLNLTHNFNVSDLGARLPESITQKESERTRVYEDASFEASKRDRRTDSKKYFGKNGKNLIQATLVPGLVVLSAAFSITFSKAIAGMLVGVFIVTSVTEHFNHKYMGHNSIFNTIDNIKNEKLKFLMNKIKFLFRYVEEGYAGHTKIHHATFKDYMGKNPDTQKIEIASGSYAKQFANDEHRKFIENRILDEGLSLERQKKDKYGVSLDMQGRLVFVASALPIEFLISSLTQFDPVFGTGMFLGSLLFQFNSADMHPYLHKNRQQALNEASPLMKLYLRTSYLEQIARRHYVHHKNADVNVNITPFNFGDFLFGTLQDSNLEQLLGMRADGVIGGTWDADGIE